jgi:predicted sulfurtransferase
MELFTVGIILLFYKYIHIQDPIAIQTWQKKLCKQLGLTGRILLAHEGINGTVGGSDQATQEYIAAMNQHPLFGEIDFKTAAGGAHAFPRMKISVKREIVHLGIDPQALTVAETAQHLTPAQTHELLQNPPQDLVVLDGRNNYEAAVGKFAGAITPDIRYFRQFPEYVDHNLDQFKDKTVLMYCTGGIRCERASAYLEQKKVAKKIYQVQGGIHRYIEQYPDGFFRGKNYVFDQRITLKVNDDVLSSCLHCKNPNDDYMNCLNALCNKHFTCCTDCAQQFANTCSERCQNLVASKQVAQRIPLQKMTKSSQT